MADVQFRVIYLKDSDIPEQVNQLLLDAGIGEPQLNEIVGRQKSTESALTDAIYLAFELSPAVVPALYGLWKWLRSKKSDPKVEFNNCHIQVINNDNPVFINSDQITTTQVDNEEQLQHLLQGMLSQIEKPPEGECPEESEE